MPCTSCTRYVEGSIDAHGFDRLALRQGWEGDDPGDLARAGRQPRPRTLADVEDLGLPLGKLVDIPAKWFLMGSQLGGRPTGRRSRSAASCGPPAGWPGASRSARPSFVPTSCCCSTACSSSRPMCWALCRQRGIDVVTYERA